jgi:adenosylcobinamide-GDP ribazoletransferase
MKNFLQALSFLTTLPSGQNSVSDERDLARSMAFFSLVGLLIGLLLTLGYFLLSFLLPKSLVLWLTLGLLAFLTRGLHLDGFADTIDGLASGGPREKILEVMRDSRIGAFGVIGLIFLIGAKYLSLDQMVLVCFRSAYARSAEGLAKPFAENLTAREMILSSVVAFGIGLLLMGVKGVVVFLGTVLFSLGYRFFFIKKLKGVTGDILGGANELAEVICLILLVILE